MYCDKNYKTKKELKEDIAAGKEITYHNPGIGDVPMNGEISITGPHGYHKWYARAIVKDGKIVSVK